ncbi:lytic transglycosylase [Bacillus sp. USDA818B3_A]|uniref:lytic transglycosylase n=1 Tax=Bacillus sp. USDA818B3_A TaxID=2698834 RepID=UPI00136E329E|nr:LysM peptidoglycan-binding domain-containing protein [Bacillus sp. USDA818B3_A]
MKKPEKERFQLFYIVNPADTLWSISKKFGVSMKELKRLNNLTTEKLVVDQVLKIKENQSDKQTGNQTLVSNLLPAAQTKKFQTYIVNPSDTLWGISKKFEVSIAQIMKLNGLTSDQIYVDQVLKIQELLDDEPIFNENFKEITPDQIPGGPQAKRWIKYIMEAAKKYEVPSKILYSIMVTESRGNPNLVAPDGGIGLMQFQIETANALGINPCLPDASIDGAARYLKQLFGEFNDWTLAIAAYNCGPTKVKAHNGIPPIEVTQNYVKNVLSYSKAINWDND